MRASYSLLLLALAPLLAGAIREAPEQGVRAVEEVQEVQEELHILEKGDWPDGSGGDWPSGGGDWPGPPDDDKDDPETRLPVTSGKIINLHASRTARYCNVDDKDGSNELRCSEAKPEDANGGLLIIGTDYMTQKIASGDTVFIKSQRSNKFCAVKPRSSEVLCDQMMSGPTTEFVLLRAKHRDETAVFVVPKAAPDHLCAPLDARPFSMRCHRGNKRHAAVLHIEDAGGSWGPPALEEGHDGSHELDDEEDLVADSTIPLEDGTSIRVFWKEIEAAQGQQGGSQEDSGFAYYSAEPMDSNDAEAGYDGEGAFMPIYYEDSESGHHGDPYDAYSYDEDGSLLDMVEDIWEGLLGDEDGYGDEDGDGGDFYYDDAFRPEEFEGGDSGDDDREFEGTGGDAVEARNRFFARLSSWGWGDEGTGDDDHHHHHKGHGSASSSDDDDVEGLRFSDNVISMDDVGGDEDSDFFEPYFSDDGDDDDDAEVELRGSPASEYFGEFDLDESSFSADDDHEASSSDDDDHEASSSDDDDHEASSSDDDDHEASSSDDDDHEASSSDDDDHEASSSDDDDHWASSSDDDDHWASSSDDDDHWASSSDDDDHDHDSSDDDDDDHDSSDDDDDHDHDHDSSDDDDDDHDSSDDDDDDDDHKARKHRHDLPNPTGAARGEEGGMMQSAARAAQHAWARFRDLFA